MAKRGSPRSSVILIDDASLMCQSTLLGRGAPSKPALITSFRNVQLGYMKNHTGLRLLLTHTHSKITAKQYKEEEMITHQGCATSGSDRPVDSYNTASPLTSSGNNGFREWPYAQVKIAKHPEPHPSREPAQSGRGAGRIPRSARWPRPLLTTNAVD
ncbi:hypothetical protein RRG08_034403 [Elysia crispata]|uniref:Uncharacterized protein n=1 Tax=Elysia crispata TaxID=231223 RepID=A0AAE0YEL5_9GAST|nr:hypothetical protein RRG08_034403 [Elysia crispata]